MEGPSVGHVVLFRIGPDTGGNDHLQVLGHGPLGGVEGQGIHAVVGGPAQAVMEIQIYLYPPPQDLSLRNASLADDLQIVVTGFLHRLEVFLSRAPAGQPGALDLQQLSELAHVLQHLVRHIEVADGVQVGVERKLFGEGAVPRPDGHQAVGAELLKGHADGQAADAEHLRQLRLRRQAFSRLPRAVHQQLAQLLFHLVVERLPLDLQAPGFHSFTFFRAVSALYCITER